MGTDPATDVEVFGAGRSMTNYYGVWTSRDGRWLVVSASDGTAPRNDVWIADLAASDPARPEFGTVVEGEDANTGAWVGRDGRLYVFTDLDAPRGRLAVADPREPGVEGWRTWSRRARRCWTTSRSWTARSWPSRCWWWAGPSTR